MTRFEYHQDILRDFPNIIGGVIRADGLTNSPTPPVLLDLYLREQQAVKARLGETPLSEVESLNAWRRAFSAFGVSPTQYRSASEALLRRLMKKGDIPSINTLVDIGNLVSMRYALPVAIFDTREISGKITVHYADGSEHFAELGSDEVIHPEPDEVVFSDEKQMVVARRWCWRQSSTSAAVAHTTSAIITVEAQHMKAQAEIENAVRDLIDLLQTYAGGVFSSAVLTRENPAM